MFLKLSLRKLPIINKQLGFIVEVLRSERVKLRIKVLYWIPNQYALQQQTRLNMIIME